MKDWNSVEKAVEKGPIHAGVKIILIFAVLSAVIWGIGTVFGVVGETAQVAKEQFGARAMLQKYEWFKDCSAQLDSKIASIDVYQQRITGLEGDYEGVPRKDWPRTDREQMSQWRAEVAGVKASYNNLSAEYNAQMSKFNWSFANAGSLPEGASKPLPREYKPYLER